MRERRNRSWKVLEVEEVFQALKEQGYKMTPQRRAVLRALAESKEFMNAHTILEKVRETHPDVGLDTIYRNLKLFIMLGFVSPINYPGREGTVYELNKNKHHHHHSVCLLCGKIECLDYCPVHFDELKSMTADQFRMVSHSLEIYGYCKTCEKNDTTK